MHPRTRIAGTARLRISRSLANQGKGSCSPARRHWRRWFAAAFARCCCALSFARCPGFRAGSGGLSDLLWTRCSLALRWRTASPAGLVLGVGIGVVDHREPHREGYDGHDGNKDGGQHRSSHRICSLLSCRVGQTRPSLFSLHRGDFPRCQWPTARRPRTLGLPSRSPERYHVPQGPRLVSRQAAERCAGCIWQEVRESSGGHACRG